jgi:hypothetical protein
VLWPEKFFCYHDLLCGRSAVMASGQRCATMGVRQSPSAYHASFNLIDADTEKKSRQDGRVGYGARLRSP